MAFSLLSLANAVPLHYVCHRVLYWTKSDDKQTTFSAQGRSYCLQLWHGSAIAVHVERGRFFYSNNNNNDDKKV